MVLVDNHSFIHKQAISIENIKDGVFQSCGGNISGLAGPMSMKFSAKIHLIERSVLNEKIFLKTFFLIL